MQKIITELDAALGETITLLSQYDVTSINTVPFKGSWTAAQTGDHILKTIAGIEELFHKKMQEANRPADERVGEYKRILLDFNLKMESPEFILPGKDYYDKEWLLESLEKVKQNVKKVLPAANLTELADLPEQHPLHGSTKLELAHFLTYHTQRHNQQIKNIMQKV